MPKLKSNRAAKRFKKLASGRFKRRSSHKRHILTKKSAKRKRQLGGTHVLAAVDHRSVARMLTV